MLDRTSAAFADGYNDASLESLGALAASTSRAGPSLERAALPLHVVAWWRANARPIYDTEGGWRLHAKNRQHARQRAPRLPRRQDQGRRRMSRRMSRLAVVRRELDLSQVMVDVDQA